MIPFPARIKNSKTIEYWKEKHPTAFILGSFDPNYNTYHIIEEISKIKGIKEVLKRSDVYGITIIVEPDANYEILDLITKMGKIGEVDIVAKLKL